MIIKAACTACTKPMIVEDYEVGQAVNCPYCGNMFVPPPPKNRVAPAVPPPGPPKAGMPIVKGPGPAHAPAPAPVVARQPAGSGILQPGSGVLQQGRPPGSSTRQPKPAGLSGQHPPVVVPVVEGQAVGPPPSSRRMKQAGVVPVVEGHAVGVPSGKRRRKPTGAGIDGLSGFLFGVVAILMIVLAVMPFMTWLKGTVVAKDKSGGTIVTSTYSLQGSGNATTSRHNNIAGEWTANPPPVATTLRTEAVLLMTLTLVILFLGLVALLCQIYGPANQPWPPQIFGAGLALLAVWSVVALLWISGDIWKVFTVSDEVAKLLKENVRDSFDPTKKGGDPTSSVSVGLGLWLGMVSALLCVILLIFVGKRRGRMLWVLIAMGIGFLIGLIVMFAVVQPTKPEGGFIGNPAETVPQKGW
jgi:hypothetical protein